MGLRFLRERALHAPAGELASHLLTDHSAALIVLPMATLDSGTIAATRMARTPAELASFWYKPLDKPRTQSRRRRATSQPPRDIRRARRPVTRAPCLPLRRAVGNGAPGGARDAAPGGANRHAIRGPGGKFCTKDAADFTGLTPPHTEATTTQLDGGHPSAAATAVVAAAPGESGPGVVARGAAAAAVAGPPSAYAGGGVLVPTHRPPMAVPATRLFPALGSVPGGQQGGTIVDRARNSEHDYEFVNFLHDYSERSIDLPSRNDKDRPSCTGKRRAHIFALQLSRARAFHSGQAQNWHAEIPVRVEHWGADTQGGHLPLLDSRPPDQATPGA